MDSYPEGHPAAGLLAAYAGHRLGRAERSALEAHLTVCDVCRAEVTRQAGRRRRLRLWPVALPLLAAAGLLALVLSRPAEQLRPDPERALRHAAQTLTREGAPRLSAVAPPPDASAGRAGLTFAWRGAVPGALYRVTLLDDRGELVWAGNTADTLLALPHATAMRAGGVYVWAVDAFAGGRLAASTGPQRFTLARPAGAAPR